MLGKAVLQPCMNQTFYLKNCYFDLQNPWKIQRGLYVTISRNSDNILATVH